MTLLVENIGKTLSDINCISVFSSQSQIRRNKSKDFLCSPGVKNLSCNAGDASFIPGQGTKIPHAVGQLGLSVATKTQCSQINKRKEEKKK